MAGKTRPSLRAKTLMNVATSNLSMTDKKCIESVFAKFDAMSKADVVEIPCRCNECKLFVENKEALVTYCTRECKNLTVNPSDFCSYGERKEGAE